MFEIFENALQQPSFRLLAQNGQIVLASESYSSLENCQAGIASVKANASSPEQFEVRTAADGKQYFVLKGANGEILGTSETYESAAALEGGIASVTANASGDIRTATA